MTLDVLSDGRLELGLGGMARRGVSRHGHRVRPARRRISRLEDVIEGLRAFAADGMANVANGAIRWRDFEGLPKPSSVGRIRRLMIGGGSPRILRIAGREADIASLNFNNRRGVIGPDGVQSSSAAETKKKIGWIRDGAGARFRRGRDRDRRVFHIRNGRREADGVDFLRRTFGFSVSGDAAAPARVVRRRRYDLRGVAAASRRVRHLLRDRAEDAMAGFAPVVARLSGK
jgi:alkanesulfonate monooxygenase SsuD/methylene tetrahydromethanopterin reductase-like flavin-dependent oxidoreductase (luciferase family)